MRRGSLFKLMGDCESTSTRTPQRDRQPAPNGDRQSPPQTTPPPPAKYSIQSGFFDQGEPISLSLTRPTGRPTQADCTCQPNGAYAAAHTYMPTQAPQAFYVEPFDAQPEVGAVRGLAPTPSAPPAAAGNGHSPAPAPTPAPAAPSASTPAASPPRDGLKTTPTEVVPSDDEAFEADLREILAGKKRYDAQHRRAVTAEEATPDQDAARARPSTAKPPEPAAEKNEHEIFERIAQSMKLANAYDLGSVALNQRFDVFDSEADQREKKKSR